jgi:FMN phosphatase YigB (HAD superfamily)
LAGTGRKLTRTIELDPDMFNRCTRGQYYDLFPDVTPTLEFLKRNGFQTGVISNTDERISKSSPSVLSSSTYTNFLTIVLLLRNLQLDKYFNFILSSVHGGSEKPSRQIFEKARELIPNSISLDEVLHIGDDEEKDYQGAIDPGENAAFLDREKILFEDTPENINACKSKSLNYTSILYLNELYPLMCNQFK